MAEQSRPKILADKIRKAREFSVPIAGFVFICRRPTELEWYDQISGAGSTSRFLPFIVGWEKVTEGDLIAGGDPHPLPFDASVCAEWMSDRTDLYGPIIGAINDAFTAHAVARKDLEKNSLPGSNP